MEHVLFYRISFLYYVTLLKVLLHLSIFAMENFFAEKQIFAVWPWTKAD